MTRTDFMTPGEAALALRRCVKTVRRHIADGTLSAVRVGRHWLIARETIERIHAAASPSKGEP